VIGTILALNLLCLPLAEAVQPHDVRAPANGCRMHTIQAVAGDGQRPPAVRRPDSAIPTRAGLRTPPPPQAATDSWFGSDKLRHFFMAFAVTGFAHAGLRALGAEGNAAVLGGVAVSLSAGLGKEVHDVRTGRGFSLRDLAWDLAGAAAGALLLDRAR
jgi:putative lipoprotein